MLPLEFRPFASTARPLTSLEDIGQQSHAHRLDTLNSYAWLYLAMYYHILDASLVKSALIIKIFGDSAGNTHDLLIDLA
ncbi:MAG: hypothetical protein K1V76_06765 [Candidatus Amulumruptor sp.]